MERSSDRLLLIEPPFYRLFKKSYGLDRYPIGLGYLAATVWRDTDWDVMAYNADFTAEYELLQFSYLAGEGFRNYRQSLEDETGSPAWEEVRATIAEYRPRVLGISAKSQNFAAARVVARIAKAIDADILVVMGGPHPSMVGGQILEYPEIDICARGEGEQTLLDILQAARGQLDLAQIPGISFRQDGQNVDNPPRPLIQDLDSLPIPHEVAPQVLKDFDKYPRTAFRFIFAIRGCPYNCFFCGSREVWGRRVRFRSVENVVREIKGLQAMGLSSVIFDDDTFGVKRSYIEDLCNALIQECRGLRWSCELPVKLVDGDIVALMKQAGCYSIFIGIESGNNEMLRKIRKDITIEDALEACRIIRQHDIELNVFFIIGFPEETEETLNDTIQAMRQVKASRVIYSIFTPYPGTEAFEFCQEHDLIPHPYDVSLYNHQSPQNHFSMHISFERFTELARQTEKVVDKRNRVNRMMRILTGKELWRIRDMGFEVVVTKLGQQITRRFR